MRIYVFLFFIVAFFFIPEKAMAVKSVVQTENVSATAGGALIEKDISKKTLSERFIDFRNKMILKVLKPKKKKRKKKKGVDRLKQYLWGYILTSVGALGLYVLGYVVILVFASEIAVLIALIMWLLAVLLGLASSVLFILWLIELTNRMD